MLLLRLLLFLISTLKNEAMNWFPYARFFNISESKVNSFSPYFCSMNQFVDKCCDCEELAYSSHNNPCIDINWDPSIHKDLESFLKETYLTIREHEDFLEEACLPVINQIPVNAGHLVEHVRILSNRYYDFSNITDCVDYNSKEFQFLPYTSYSGLIYGRECFDKFVFDEYIKKYLPIKVYCSQVNNLTLDMIFHVGDISSLEKCIFVADTFNDTDLQRIIDRDRCVHQKGFCDRSNPLYSLCRTYSAPIRGYKNIHCAQCDNQVWDHYEEVESCSSCKNGACDLRQFVDPLKHPVSFSLVPDDKGTEFKVKNITREFPLEEFIGVGPILAQQFKYFLCHQNMSCCSCERNCMKFQTCCIDALWNNNLPMEINEYKNLLINTSRKYKKHNCVYLIPLLQDNSARYHMIKDCLPDPHYVSYTIYDQMRCIGKRGYTTDTIIPVVGEDGYLYRNKFCARCNNVDKYTPVNLICHHLIPDVLDLQKDCYFEIDSSIDDAVKECQIYHDKCDPDNVNYNLCKAYKGDIGIYRNYHCYLCEASNTTIPSAKQCHDHKFDFFKGKTVISFENDTLRVSSVTPPKRHMCDTEIIFDLFGDGCRKYEIRSLTDGEFDRCFDRRTTTLFAKVNSQRNIDIYFQKLLPLIFDGNGTFETYSMDPLQSIVRFESNKTIQAKILIEYYVDILNKLLKQHLKIDHFFISSFKEPFISREQNLDIENSFPGGKICYELRNLNRTKTSFTDSCTINYDKKEMYTSVNMWMVINQHTVSRFISICKEFYLDPKTCPLKTVNISAINGDGTLIYQDENEKLITKPVSEYMPVLNGVAVVCIPVKSNNRWINYVHKSNFIMSITGRSANLILYAKIIRDAFHVYQLRGHLFLSSSLVLLDLSSIVLAVSNHIGLNHQVVFCDIVAKVIHFGFIMVQIWCVICCFDLWSHMASNRFRFGVNRIYYYIIINISITAFLVFVFGYILDYLGLISLGYIDNNTCFASNFLGELCFHIIPFIISMILSICLLGKTMLYLFLKKEDQFSRAVSKDSWQQVVLTLKIVIVVELVEVMGFIREYDNQGNQDDLFYPIFGFLYELYNCIKGIVICYLIHSAKRKIEQTTRMQRLASSKTMSVVSHSNVHDENKC